MASVRLSVSSAVVVFTEGMTGTSARASASVVEIGTAGSRQSMTASGQVYALCAIEEQIEQRVGSEQLVAKWPTSPQLKQAYDWQVLASWPGR